MELWVLRVLCVVGWLLVGWLFRQFVRSRDLLFGDLVVDKTSSEVFLHCPHQPEELLEHEYIMLKIINFNKAYTRK